MITSISNLFSLYLRAFPGICLFIAAVLLIRFLLRRRATAQMFLLWFFVLIRLLLPVSIETDHGFGMIRIPDRILTLAPKEDDQFSQENEQYQQEGDEKKRDQRLTGATWFPGMIWIAGVLCFLAYYGIRFVSLYRKIKKAAPLHGYHNVFLWDQQDACTVGIFRPRAYIPFTCSKRTRDCVIQHELQHIRHHDCQLLFFFYIALALNWYNPLAWISYRYFQQDMEKACDERVLAYADTAGRKDYAAALVHFYCGYRENYISAGFRGTDIRERIKNIGKTGDRKPIRKGLLVLLCGFLFCLCLFTGLQRTAGSPVQTFTGAGITYYLMEDGSYQYGKKNYSDRVVLSGTLPNSDATAEVTVLTNDRNLTFERAVWSLFSSDLSDSDPDLFMVVDMR